MHQYNENLRALYETPVPSADPADMESGRAKARLLLETIRKSGRTILTEAESKELLGCYGIPIVTTKIAKTEAAAVKTAAQIGFPVVLKLYSETITHKTDVGGVQLNLKDESDVRQAFNDIKKAVSEKKGAEHFQGVTVQKMIKLSEGYELILGSSIDPQFGPVLLFGMGGQLVEVFKDKALGLPPLNTTLARRMIETTRIYKALQGVRGRKPVDLPALERLMVGFSQLVAEQRWIRELDINPLFASGDDLVALDARVILHEPKTPEEQLPRLAIRPYPTQYTETWKTRGPAAVTLTIRPIRPEDEPAMVGFHQGLSERSVYLRYFSPLKLQQRVAHSRLLRICFNDYDREIALVAERSLGKGRYEILGVCRLSKLQGSSAAEFAVVVTDQWQNKGLGTELTKRLVQMARNEKLTRLIAYTLMENHYMQATCRKLGFEVKRSAAENECVIEMSL
jgi:acetyltransferase